MPLFLPSFLISSLVLKGAAMPKAVVVQRKMIGNLTEEDQRQEVVKTVCKYYGVWEPPPNPLTRFTSTHPLITSTRPLITSTHPLIISTHPLIHPTPHQVNINTPSHNINTPSHTPNPLTRFTSTHPLITFTHLHIILAHPLTTRTHPFIISLTLPGIYFSNESYR